MKRLSLLCLVTLVAIVLCTAFTTTADARKDYSDILEARYVGDATTKAQQELKATITALGSKRCYACHDPKPGDSGRRSKKNRNAFGKALEAAGLTKTKAYISFSNRKDAETLVKKKAAINAAFEAVENEKLGNSEQTIGELFQSGKLPITYTAKELE